MAQARRKRKRPARSRRRSRKAPRARPIDELRVVRTRRAAADARMAELALLEREGKLLPVESLERLVAGIARELRARITAFPGKYAPRVVGLKTIAEGQAFLEQIANEFLTALRETGRELRDRETSGAERAESHRGGRPRGPAARPAADRQ